jgi:cytochrome P450
MWFAHVGHPRHQLPQYGRDLAPREVRTQAEVRPSPSERHLAFGKNLHYCLDANLGKLEAQIAVAALAGRYPRLRLAADQRLAFHPNISFRGPKVLRVRTQGGG